MTNSRRRDHHEQLTYDIAAANKAARRWHLSSLWLIAILAICAPQVYTWWLDRRVYATPVDVLINAADRGENVELAIEGLRAHGMAIIRAIEKHEKDDGRRGILARNALEHFRKELIR